MQSPDCREELADEVARTCIETFTVLPKSRQPVPRSNGVPQHAILAGFVLSKVEGNSGRLTHKCVAIATGSKCLPADCLSPKGDIVHDSHAEVLARRCALRWFYEEIVRCASDEGNSDWIGKIENGKYSLLGGIAVSLYVSAIPCGDASMLSLAAVQDPVMSQLKSNCEISEPMLDVLRGRNGYDRIGVLRTKPGRADSKPTLSMSCSDKIALWTIVGIQSALLSEILQPLYIDQLVFGGVQPDLMDATLGECQRAFVTRLHSDIPPFAQHPPRISLTERRFPFEPFTDAQGINSVPCFECVTWIADPGSVEVIVQGLKRGATAKSGRKGWSRVCKSEMFELHRRTFDMILPLRPNLRLSYHDTKRAVQQYQVVKRLLRSEGGPLSGWIASGSGGEMFFAITEAHDSA